ncbi:hypothetical protein QBC43DRAFT_325630 [Cladorrhinum sp. PSN259]|nr:hypothetical protein QBC43DRAFT_325630 [Cladorrhinum sp. PSN259]
MSLLSPATISHLQTLYSHASRHYHSLSHISTLLTLLTTHRSQFCDPEAVEAAIWFHDAIYDARAAPPSNELASAELAVTHLRDSVNPERLHYIKKMIEGTATHTVPECEDEAAVRDAELFLDMDLSILGADREEFDHYEQGVRKEYGHVSEEDWKAGRAKVLKGFLERKWIFHSETFRVLLEEKARVNLRRSIERLEGTLSGEVN